MAKWPNWLRTARARSTFAATGIVATALIIAGFAALTLQRRALVDGIDTALNARVDDLSALIVDGVVPAQLTVPGDDEALVQIVDNTGTVIAASANIEGEDPITNVQPAANTTTLTSQVLPIGEDEFRLVARTVDAHDQLFTVYAASSLESVADVVATLRGLLLVGIPMLIGFVGVTVWIIIGKTLHPVEAIRSQVASIGDRHLDRRVPVPDTDDEIGRLADTMNEMLNRLEQASNQQRRFVADASHELRNPLAAIRSQLEVDLVHPEQADWPTANREVLDETLRMQRLVDDLLLLARSDTGTLPNIRRAVDLDDIVFIETERLKTPSNITINTSHVSGAQVIGNPEALGRLIRNLLENAVRYATSRINITLAETDGTATLTIADDGPGIPPVDRTRIFDQFTRLDEARDRDHGGAGLGLAIAKEITQHHTGTINVDTSTLGGTRITVTIPTKSR